MAQSSHCGFPDGTLRGPHKSFRVTLGCVGGGLCEERPDGWGSHPLL